MTDQLKVTYADLQEAAAAMTRSSTRVGDALRALTGAGTVNGDVFGDKGEKIARWYEPNVTSAEAAVRASSHSFTVLAQGLHRAAAVYALIDAQLGRNAHNQGAH